MKKDNIVLIGMPGVGKSTAGVILAKVLGYEFVDADLVIQKEEGKLLKEIIEEVGTDGFIAVENRVNSSLEVDHSIIATGGSVVYGKEAMEHLKSIGTVVYLQLPFEELNRRLSDIKGRGVVLKNRVDKKSDHRTICDSGFIFGFTVFCSFTESYDRTEIPAGLF